MDGWMYINYWGMQATIGSHVVKWTVANEVDLVFVLVYNKVIFASISHVDELLARMKEVPIHSATTTSSVIIVLYEMLGGGGGGRISCVPMTGSPSKRRCAPCPTSKGSARYRRRWRPEPNPNDGKGEVVAVIVRPMPGDRRPVGTVY